MELILVILLLFIIITYLAIKYPDNSIGTRYRPDLKGPKGWPILGNIEILFKYPPMIIMYEDRKIYGPIAYVINFLLFQYFTLKKFIY